MPAIDLFGVAVGVLPPILAVLAVYEGADTRKHLIRVIASGLVAAILSFIPLVNSLVTGAGVPEVLGISLSTELQIMFPLLAFIAAMVNYGVAAVVAWLIKGIEGTIRL